MVSMRWIWNLAYPPHAHHGVVTRDIEVIDTYEQWLLMFYFGGVWEQQQQQQQEE